MSLFRKRKLYGIRPYYMADGDAAGGAGDGGAAGSGDAAGNTNDGASGGSNANAGGTSLTGGSDGGAAAGQAGTTTPDWASSLPDDLKSNPSLSKFKDLPSFVKDAIEAEKLIGKKGLIKPDKGADQAQWDKYYKDLGRPDKSEGYELKRPESWPKELGFDEALVPKVADMFHKRGIDKDTAAGLWNDYHQLISEQGTAALGTSKAEVERGIASLKQELGGDEQYNAHLETAKMAVKEFGGDGLIKFLNDSGLGNHPALIKAFGEAGKFLREDAIVGGRTGGYGMTPDKAKAEIAKLEADTKFMDVYMSSDNSIRKQQKENQAIMERLHKQAYPTISAGV